jgi:creatinine amidohydrolase
MGAKVLEEMAWPEVQAAIAGGHDTVVVAFGTTEQHGPHLPLATDVLLGAHLARRVADELDAFVAPTMRIGCSAHHLAFPGTLSLRDTTFHAVVADLVESLVRGGFRRIVLLPSHGGNFIPLAAAVARMDEHEGVDVVALTDIEVLMQIALLGHEELGVPMAEGGLHAGEWETSMLLAVEPAAVRMDRAEPGYTGDPETALQSLFGTGVQEIAANGVIGDPLRARAAHGEAYWEKAVELAVAAVEAAAPRP